MSRSRSHLLDAASSHTARPEDRLTEVVACALDACDPLASELFRAFDLPTCDRYEVYTQEKVAPGSQPDMRVNGLTSDGALRARLWCEHKLDARWQTEQVARYKAAHDAAPGEGKVVCIVKSPPPFACEFITWQRFAEICERVGRTWGGPHWTERACDGDTPGKWRVLAELAWYLEEKQGFAVVEPLDARKLEVFGGLGEAMGCLLTLVEDAAGRVEGLSPYEGDLEGGFDAVTVSFEPPPDSWLARYTDGAYPDIVVAARDFWSAQHLDVPVLSAGVSVDERRVFPHLSASRGWVDAVVAAGFSCSLWEGWARVYRTRPASDVLDFGDTLDAQASGVAAWAGEAIAAAIALDPRTFESADPEDDRPAAALTRARASTRARTRRR